MSVSVGFLLRRAQEGDDRAAAALLERYERLLRSVACNYYAPGHDFEDLVQEARVGAMEAIDTFEAGRGDLTGFVVLCAHRKVITAVKAAQRRKHGPLSTSLRETRDLDGEPVAASELVASPDLEPAEAIAAREELRDLATRMRERLSDRECACLLGWLNLSAAGGQQDTYALIAARLGLTAKQVDVALTRARWKLRGKGPASSPGIATSRRRGDRGYRCPSCGGATVKRPGRGRPPRCVVCRMRTAA